MNWNKLRKQLESFLHPDVQEQVQYVQAGYRVRNDKKTLSYLTVNKIEVFNQAKLPENWFESEQAIRNLSVNVHITEEILASVRERVSDKVPDERLEAIARKEMQDKIVKALWHTQVQLLKLDFQKVAAEYLSIGVDQALKTDDILLNILAILDRRTGKNRVRKLQKKNIHPLVRLFVDLRL
jgi:hypothetical protein